MQYIANFGLLILALFLSFDQPASSDVVVQHLEEYDNHVVLDLVVRGESGARSSLIYSGTSNNVIAFAASIDVRDVLSQLRSHNFAVAHEQGGNERELVLHEWNKRTVAFASVQRRGVVNRYQIYLYFEDLLDWDALYDAGVALENAGHLVEAIRYWEFILSRYGIHRKALHRMAEIHYVEGEYETAEAMYEATIDLDERTWHYPEARIRYALARDLREEPLTARHRTCLKDYIRFGKGKQHVEALRLLTQVERPIHMDVLTSHSAGAAKKQIEKSEKALIYFWSPATEQSWPALDPLFAFAVRDRDVNIFVVAVNGHEQLQKHEWRLTKQFVPYWPAKSDCNVHFLLDNRGYLRQALLPSEMVGQIQWPTVLFMDKKSIVRFEDGVIAWAQIQSDLTSVWERKGSK